MKSKNLFKKSISTLLCVSTLIFSTGLLNARGNFICKMINGTEKCFPFSIENFVKFKKDGNYSICDDSGICKYFNEKNELIGSNVGNIAPAQKSSAINSITSNFFYYTLASSVSSIASLIVSKAFELSFKALDYYERSKNEAKMKKEGLIDPIEAINRLDHYLEDVKGQDKALSEVRKFVLNLIDERNQKINGISKKNGINNILYFTGPSGIGKSLTAEYLVKTLNGPNAEPFIFEPSCLSSDSKIFGVVPIKMKFGEKNQFTDVVSQLVRNPYTVFIFNEVDKYDKKGEKIYLKELEETFRTIIDHGYIYINGSKIDCSKAIFIMTSNADLKSVNKEQPVEDATGSLTQVEHDKSFLNRIKIVEFENLNTEAYKKIAKPKFKALQQRYLDEYNIFVTFNDDFLNGIANLVEQRNQGARPIQDFVNAINSKLLNEVILPGANNKSYLGKTIEVSVENNSEFKLTESDNYKKALQIPLEKLKQYYLSEHNININISDQALDEVSKSLKEINSKKPPIASVINLLANKINEDIILNENSKKSLGQKMLEKFGSSKDPSYFGKTYDVQFNNYKWEISEPNSSQSQRKIPTKVEQVPPSDGKTKES